MAFKCKICGKGPVAGNSYSHSHMATKRKFQPNLQRQKVLISGVPQTAYICTTCIRSGFAVRPTK